MVRKREKELTDKITRGSVVGQFHEAGLGAPGTDANFKRGWSIKTLDTCPPRPNAPRKNSATYRTTEDWFEHAPPNKPGPPDRLHFISPRYWREAMGRSPCKGVGGVPSGPAAADELAYTQSVPNLRAAGKASRTFDLSENWMIDPSPSTTDAVNGTNLVPGQKAVLGREGIGVVPAEAHSDGPLANAVDGKPCFGKRTYGTALSASAARRRLQQDSNEPIFEERGRRAVNPLAPEPAATDVPSPKSRFFSNASSVEMEQAVKGEAGVNKQAGEDLIKETKYMAGSQVVTASKVGRRPAMVSTDPISYAGYLMRSPAPRHQHNSDELRLHLQQAHGGPPPPVTYAYPAVQRLDPAVAQPAGLMTPKSVPASPRTAVHMFRDHSVVRGQVAKGTAFLHSATVRPVQSLRPGVFSPHRPAGFVYHVKPTST
jgi:hypothetical protein